jgi:hypothetical protein
MNEPPLTSMVLPVTSDDDWHARKRRTPAISSGFLGQVMAEGHKLPWLWRQWWHRRGASKDDKAHNHSAGADANQCATPIGDRGKLAALQPK